MFTEDELLKFKSLGRENDGSFSDRSDIILRPKNKRRTMWKLYIFDEVDGSEEFLIDINSKEDLEDIYFSIFNKILN
jgi:hypothetical protein